MAQTLDERPTHLLLRLSVNDTTFAVVGAGAGAGGIDAAIELDTVVAGSGFIVGSFNGFAWPWHPFWRLWGPASIPCEGTVSNLGANNTAFAAFAQTTEKPTQTLTCHLLLAYAAACFCVLLLQCEHGSVL